MPCWNRQSAGTVSKRILGVQAETDAPELFGNAIAMAIDMQRHGAEVAVAAFKIRPLAQTVAAQHAQDQVHGVVTQEHRLHAGCSLPEIIAFCGNDVGGDARIGLSNRGIDGIGGRIDQRTCAAEIDMDGRALDHFGAEDSDAFTDAASRFLE